MGDFRACFEERGKRKCVKVKGSTKVEENEQEEMEEGKKMKES